MQADLFSPSEKGHAAAKAAADRADRHIDEWTEKAVALFAQYARQSTQPFLTEEARQYAESHGLPEPTDGRAWGHVAQKCKREKVVVPVGFGSAKSSNGSPKVLWRAK